MPTAPFSPARVLNIFPFALGGSLSNGNPQGTYLSLNSPVNYTGDLLHFQANNQSLWTMVPSGLVTHTLFDGAANVVNPVLIIGHQSSGGVSNGFGASLQAQLQTSNGSVQTAGEWQVSWANAGVTNRRGKMIFNIWNVSGGQTALQLETNGSVPMIGVLGASPVPQQTGGDATASETYGTTEADMLNKIYSALRLFGYLS